MKANSAAKFLGTSVSSFAAGLLVVALQGCAPQNTNATGPISNMAFKINGAPTDESGMLAARESALDKQVAGLGTEADPIKGRAIIILPDHDRLRPLVAQLQAVALKRPVVGQALEAFVDEEQQAIRELADGIVKNGAFQTVTKDERNDVLDLPTTDVDYIIVYQVRTLVPNTSGPWTGYWIVRRSGNPQTLTAAVDQGTAVGTPRIASFVKNVRQDALRLGGTSVDGKTAASLPASSGPSLATSGSGIVIDKQGDIVTAAHVVGTCTDPTVIDSNNTHYPAHIGAKDDANDIALLKADHRWPLAASFRDGGEVRVGENIFAVGYPLTGLVASSSIVTTGSVNANAGPRDDSRLFQISAPVQPGNSGGAVLDNAGHLVGVVTSELNGALLTLVAGFTPQNVNFAVKSAVVRNFLESHSVDFAHAPSTQAMSSVDVSALARKISVRIQCGGN